MTVAPYRSRDVLLPPIADARCSHGCAWMHGWGVTRRKTRFHAKTCNGFEALTRDRDCDLLKSTGQIGVSFKECRMNKDQVKGRAEEVAGKVKEVAGKVTGSTSTELKGKAEQVAGKTQAAYGDAKEDAKKRP